MSATISRWLRFNVDLERKKGGATLRHSVMCRPSPDSDQTTACYSIKLTSTVRSSHYTVTAADSASCVQSIPLRWHSYVRSSISVEVQQQSNSEIEFHHVSHERGQHLQGWCRLNPLATDLGALRYLASNDDLSEAFGSDIGAARTHYLERGRFEGRRMDFDGLAYLASYPDLSVFGSDEGAACLHYINHGRREGRSILFQPAVYLDKNPDLVGTIGSRASSAIEHYLVYGRSENRPAI